MFQIAENETQREEEVLKILDVICQQLGDLGVAKVIPKEIKPRRAIINRAIDVRSASMFYLASHIHHDATWLGIAGTYMASHMH